MSPVLCSVCSENSAVCKSGQGILLCKKCFLKYIKLTVHEYIIENNIFRNGDIVGVGVSGGKDSTVLLHLLVTLKNKYRYPITLKMLAIDEGIVGYRDLSLDCVKKAQDDYKLELDITSFTDITGHTLDSISKATQYKNVCSTCGTLRRHGLSISAAKTGCTCIATGHNGDDTAETILLNVLRGDPRRLLRCSDATSECGKSIGIRRIRPLQCLTQKDIVLYARYKSLKYHSTECPYAIGAYRGNARKLLNMLEMQDPTIPMRVLDAGIQISKFSIIKETNKQPDACPKCGDPYIGRCQTCDLLERLKDNPMLRDMEDEVDIKSKKE